MRDGIQGREFMREFQQQEQPRMTRILTDLTLIKISLPPTGYLLGAVFFLPFTF